MGRIISYAASFSTQHLRSKISEDYWRAIRFNASAIRTLKNVRQLGGPEVKLINISRRGALIVSRENISLRSRISLQLATAEGIYLVKGRVIRCDTCPARDKVIEYQSAIVFEKDFAILSELLI
jgi:hypothetical protein